MADMKRLVRSQLHPYTEPLSRSELLEVLCLPRILREPEALSEGDLPVWESRRRLWGQLEELLVEDAQACARTEASAILAGSSVRRELYGLSDHVYVATTVYREMARDFFGGDWVPLAMESLAIHGWHFLEVEAKVRHTVLRGGLFVPQIRPGQLHSLVNRGRVVPALLDNVAILESDPVRAAELTSQLLAVRMPADGEALLPRLERLQKQSEERWLGEHCTAYEGLCLWLVRTALKRQEFEEPDKGDGNE